MAKKKSESTLPRVTRKVFTPTSYEVDIGGSAYEIRPRSLKELAAFSAAIEHIFEGFSGALNDWYLEDSEGNRQGPFTEEAAKAKEDPDGEGLVAVQGGWSIAEIWEQVLKTPHKILSLLIADLEEEDCEQLTLPELKWLFDILVEINGLNWFEDTLKNLLAPLLPDIMTVLLQAAQENLALDGSQANEPTLKELSGETE